ncbi:MAG: hypothetical protein J6X11_09060 [Treponema sp.]|nr:hypothetical protein [Treponema sp.]
MKRISVVLLSLFFAGNIFAQGASSDLQHPNSNFFNEFVARTWNASDGLAGNTITDLIQDSRGYIYFGTYEGLVRFDGVKFVTINHIYDRKYNFVAARVIFQDSNSNLWIGSNDEGVICIGNDGSVSTFRVENGLPNNSIRSIAEDFDGNVWVGTASGVAYITKTQDIKHPAGLTDHDEEHLLVQKLYCDTAGRMWLCGSLPGSIYCYSGGKFNRYAGITKFKDPVVRTITQDSKGAFWFGICPHYAVCIDGTEETVLDIGHGKQPGTVVNSIVQDSHSNIWFGLDSGVAVYHDGGLSFYDTSNGLCDSNANKIMEDREGNIWIATDRGGVHKLSTGKFVTVRMDTTVNAICEDSKRSVVWLGCDKGLFCYDFKKSSFVQNDITNFCSNIRIRHVGITENGSLLVSTYGHYGQIVISPDGKPKYWNKDSGLSGDMTRVSTLCSDGKLYVGTTTGLNIIDMSTNEIKIMTRDDGLPNDYIMCIYEASDGSIWCGTDGSGIFVLKDGAVKTTYTTNDGLAGNVIFKIKEVTPGEIWVCTGSGITRFRNKKCVSYSSDSGLGTDGIFQVVDDYSGNCFMTSNRGISCVTMEELDAYADGSIPKVSARFFGRSDGLISGGVTSTSLSMKDKIGRIWFTLIDGFAIYDPVKGSSNKAKPIVQIETISVDTDMTEFNNQTVIMPPDAKRLRIGFTGLSYISSENMNFRYKLDGFDSGYSDWAAERFVSYTNLKPGTYKFSVQTANVDNMLSDPSPVLTIIKEPHFWQLWYFWGLCAAAFLTVTVLAIWTRFRRLKKYQIKLEREVDAQTKELQEQAVELQNRAHALEVANDKAEKLLLNILPKPVADELTENPGRQIAKQYSNVCVFFADIVGFTKLSTGMSANEIVKMLNAIFSRFDERLLEFGVEKIKTIGDAYMAACGFEEAVLGNAAVLKMINLSRAILKEIEDFDKETGFNLLMRIGINCGPLIAGVIGKSKFIYDIWGDTVNVASRMESTGQPGRIHVTENVFLRTKDQVKYSDCVEIEVKGKGLMKTYFVE